MRLEPIKYVIFTFLRLLSAPVPLPDVTQSHMSQAARYLCFMPQSEFSSPFPSTCNCLGVQLIIPSAFQNFWSEYNSPHPQITAYVHCFMLYLYLGMFLSKSLISAIPIIHIFQMKRRGPKDSDGIPASSDHRCLLCKVIRYHLYYANISYKTSHHSLYSHSKILVLEHL